MQLTLLKAKLHRARVSHVELEYEGSCAIDGALMDAAGLVEYEQVDIYNLANGERFTTYAMRGEPGSGMISVNGAAAHKAAVGDRVIICAYAAMPQHEAAEHVPRLIYLDEHNNITHSRNRIPVQAA